MNSDDEYIIPDSQIIGELRIIEKTFRSNGELIAAAVCRDAASRLSAITNTSARLKPLTKTEIETLANNIHNNDDYTYTIECLTHHLARPQSAAVRDEAAVPIPLSVDDNQPRYTTKRMHDEIAKAREYARREALEEAAKVAECLFDDRGNGRSGHHSEMDWTDGYREATRGAAASIRDIAMREGAGNGR